MWRLQFETYNKLVKWGTESYLCFFPWRCSSNVEDYALRNKKCQAGAEWLSLMLTIYMLAYLTPILAGSMQSAARKREILTGVTLLAWVRTFSHGGLEWCHTSRGKLKKPNCHKSPTQEIDFPTKKVSRLGQYFWVTGGLEWRAGNQGWVASLHVSQLWAGWRVLHAPCRRTRELTQAMQGWRHSCCTNVNRFLTQSTIGQ